MYGRSFPLAPRAQQSTVLTYRDPSGHAATLSVPSSNALALGIGFGLGVALTIALTSRR